MVPDKSACARATMRDARATRTAQTAADAHHELARRSNLGPYDRVDALRRLHPGRSLRARRAPNRREG